LAASAGITGRGGQIAIWSTGITSVAAYIDASGGIVRGAGGIVETSGHALNTLDATINVNGGFGGIAGTWLLDPHFVVTADGDFAGVGPGAAAGDVNTGLLIRPGDLVAIYGVSSLLPDTDDAGTAGTDPDEESEHRYPYAVVPSNGLFAQIGSIGPTPIGSGVTFGLGLTTGNLILGINGEDGGPQGQYDVNVQVVSRGELAEVAIPVILLNAIPYIGELADVAFAGRIARLVKTGQEIDEAALSADAAATEFTTAGAGSLPEDVQTAIEEIKSGANRPNVKNPQPFRNDGSQDATILPRKDASGNPISYTENYVNPKINGVPRDGQRVITGSDGSTWYTPDHYTSWIKVGN
jgi:guanyl-specific ribonuclease Sa